MQSDDVCAALFCFPVVRQWTRRTRKNKTERQPHLQSMEKEWVRECLPPFTHPAYTPWCCCESGTHVSRATCISSQIIIHQFGGIKVHLQQQNIQNCHCWQSKIKQVWRGVITPHSNSLVTSAISGAAHFYLLIYRSVIFGSHCFS